MSSHLHNGLDEGDDPIMWTRYGSEAFDMNAFFCSVYESTCDGTLTVTRSIGIYKYFYLQTPLFKMCNDNLHLHPNICLTAVDTESRPGYFFLRGIKRGRLSSLGRHMFGLRVDTRPPDTSARARRQRLCPRSTGGSWRKPNHRSPACPSAEGRVSPHVAFFFFFFRALRL